MAALLQALYQNPTTFPTKVAQECIQQETKENGRTSLQEQEFIKDEDIKEIDCARTLGVDKTEKLVKRSIKIAPVSTTSTYIFKKTILQRKLLKIKALLEQLFKNNDMLANPIFYSEIKSLLQELSTNISSDENYLRIQLTYLEQAVNSTSWDTLTKGKIKTLISAINSTLSKDKWNKKSLNAISNLLLSGNFRLVKPVVYEETKDAKTNT